MCGIAGVVGAGSTNGSLLAAMGSALAHRGPDDRGHWVDRDAGVALIHRRLAVVDLSPAGHQPMVSADDRFVLVYNGEIYNHREIRAELAAAGTGGWRGHSDTETLLAAIGRYGLDGAVERCAGMFAFALWDRHRRELTLARDRFGEKPLYYGWAGRDFMFGSELKPLRTHPQFPRAIDRRAAAEMLGKGYVGAPRTIHPRLFKLEPGHFLTLPLAAMARPSEEPPRSRAYWSYREVVGAGFADPFRDPAEAEEAVHAALRQAVAGQAVADVPVGAFLSGGVDSSLVTATYQSLHPGKVKTFTIGFADPAYDESSYAAAVARHLGTEHRHLLVTEAEARAVIPLLPEMYDEPFADSSQIPTYLVSRLARSEVTVALSGDGGDELFAGYNRYTQVARLWDIVHRLPRSARRPLAALLAAVPARAWSFAGRATGRSQAHVGVKAAKFANVLRDADNLDTLIAAFLDEWQRGDPPVPHAPPYGLDPADSTLPEAPSAVQLMLRDALDYLPGDILAKVDRAAMAVSLETRVPILDHRLAAVAARVPLTMKIDRNGGKAILRSLLARYVPPRMFERPKAGFAVPLGGWLRGPLRDWAEALLDPSALAEDGLIDPAPVRARWARHLASEEDSAQALWSVLMLQAWRAEYSSQIPCSQSASGRNC